MPERTTEDYEGVPSMKVQQAIQAILQEDSRAEAIPIGTLINFNDSILEEAEKKEPQAARAQASAGSNRPKSGKRPKSAKKKKVATD
jgi:hypothetical protein